MKRVAIGVVLSFLGFGCEDSDRNPAAIENEVDRPNIVLLIGDDHGYPYFGFMGHGRVETPNLDRLAAEGIVFRQAHTTSNTCRPALWTLLNGLHPYQMHAIAWGHTGAPMQTGSAGIQQWNDLHGQYIDIVRRDPDTLPRALARAGYVSFQGGKYWEGTYDVAGFSEGMTRAKGPAEIERYGNQYTRAGADGLSLGRGNVRPVLEFIDRHRERPFFIWYAPMLPHRPHNPPERLLRRYQAPGLSPGIAAYFAMCTWYDEGVGRLLDHLERRGLRERTLVAYVSDNGWEQEPQATYRHALGGPHGKLSVHEQAFRTPIVFSWPGRIPPGRACDDLISSADLYPTFLDFAGAPVPGNRPGRSLRRRLSRGECEEEDSVLIGSTSFVRPSEEALQSGAVPFERAAVFYLSTPRWYYVRNETSGEDALYDRRQDLRGEHDVAADHGDLVLEFRERIDAWKTELRSAVDAET